MARYIDVDNLIDKCDCLYKETNTETVDFMRIGYNHAVSDTIAIARNLSTADVRENVHAHWEAEWHIVFHVYLPRCSSCGFYSPLRYNFCPNCGAQMEADYDIG